MLGPTFLSVFSLPTNRENVSPANRPLLHAGAVNTALYEKFVLSGHSARGVGHSPVMRFHKYIRSDSLQYLCQI